MLEEMVWRRMKTFLLKQICTGPSEVDEYVAKQRYTRKTVLRTLDCATFAFFYLCCFFLCELFPLRFGSQA